MATFKKDYGSLKEMAGKLINQFDNLKWLDDAGVKVDYVYAYATTDEDGKIIGDALKQHGVKALGLCRIVNLKDRAKGMGDAEITVDGDWWECVSTEEAEALLDHELYHLKPTDKTDDLGRPKLKLRKHDHQFGWFNIIAERHGSASRERQQAKSIMDDAGQYFWPGIAPTVEISLPDGTTTSAVSVGRFNQIARDMAGKSK
jgi:hypothetical protein